MFSFGDQNRLFHPETLDFGYVSQQLCHRPLILFGDLVGVLFGDPLDGINHRGVSGAQAFLQSFGFAGAHFDCPRSNPNPPAPLTMMTPGSNGRGST